MWGDHDAAVGAARWAGIDKEGCCFRSGGRNDHGGRHVSQDVALLFLVRRLVSSRFRHEIRRALVSSFKDPQKESGWAVVRFEEADAGAPAGWFKGMSRVLVERSAGADANLMRETG